MPNDNGRRNVTVSAAFRTSPEPRAREEGRGIVAFSVCVVRLRQLTPQPTAGALVCAREYEPSPRTGLMPFAACRNLEISRLAKLHTRTTTPY